MTIIRNVNEELYKDYYAFKVGSQFHPYYSITFHAAASMSSQTFL